MQTPRPRRPDPNRSRRIVELACDALGALALIAAALGVDWRLAAALTGVVLLLIAHLMDRSRRPPTGGADVAA